MPAVVDCPSCGNPVRLPEGLAGLMVFCRKCGLTFLASVAGHVPPRAPLLDIPPEKDAEPPRRPGRVPDHGDSRGPSRRRLPVDVAYQFCPRCDARLPSRAERCPSCQLVLVPDDEDGADWRGPRGLGPRRDCEPHRGPMISSLGTSAVVCGALALFFGVSSLIGLPLGITAWLLGNSDLERMRTGAMDPEGLSATRNGRDLAIMGTVLSGVFGTGWLLYAFFQIVLNGWS